MCSKTCSTLAWESKFSMIYAQDLGVEEGMARVYLIALSHDKSVSVSCVNGVLGSKHVVGCVVDSYCLVFEYLAVAKQNGWGV